MDDKTHRFSDIQKALLLALVHGFRKGVKSGKSTYLNYVVSKKLEREVHPNNFRESCKRLEERGLIMRRKVKLDWYLNITPDGLEQVVEWMDDE